MLFPHLTKKIFFILAPINQNFFNELFFENYKHLLVFASTKYTLLVVVLFEFPTLMVH